MNENLNLAEILKDCPMGTKLYSPAYGDVKLAIVRRSKDAAYPIEIELSDGIVDGFTKDGRIDVRYPGECMLFPSREQCDWSKFKPDKHKFDPKTLEPFDKVVIWRRWNMVLRLFLKPLRRYISMRWLPRRQGDAL